MQRHESNQSFKVHMKNDCALFSQMYISCKSQQNFFQYENISYTPSLPIGGNYTKELKYT